MTAPIDRPCLNPRPRQVIEQEMAAANQAIEIARDDLERAQDELADLEAELGALPPEGVDEELWYAHRDRRQLALALRQAFCDGRPGVHVRHHGALIGTEEWIVVPAWWGVMAFNLAVWGLVAWGIAVSLR